MFLLSLSCCQGCDRDLVSLRAGHLLLSQLFLVETETNHEGRDTQTRPAQYLQMPSSTKPLRMPDCTTQVSLTTLLLQWLVSSLAVHMPISATIFNFSTFVVDELEC